MFGQAKPLFGVPAPSTLGFGSSPFGSPATAAQPSTGLFGQPAAVAAPQQNIFSNSVFGQAVPAATQGSSTKFVAPISNDTIQKSGSKVTVNAKHMCITAMKEYQDKSFEELRVEDYLLNKKGSATTSSNIFGGAAKPVSFGDSSMMSAPLFGVAATSAQPTSFLGGAPASSGTFSFLGARPTQPSTSFGQTTQASLFGSKPLFGSATTTAVTPQPQLGLTFGQPAQNSLFGNKPAFGAATTTTSLFGNTFGVQPAAQPSSTQFTLNKPQGTGLFGTNPTTNLFGGTLAASQVSPFGVPASTQSTGMFGAIKPIGTSSLFPLATTTAASNFGLNSPFAAKPGAPTTNLFGSPLNNPLAPKTSGFGFPTSQGFGAAQPATITQPAFGGGIFGAKTPMFGSATPASVAVPTTGLFGTAQPNSLFGAQQTGFNANPTQSFFNTAAKQPALGFGLNTGTVGGSSLFNTNTSASIFNAQPATGLTAISTAPAVQGFWTGSGANAAATTTLNPLIEQVTQNARAQQHVLDLVRSMPYGQSSLFRHMGNSDMCTSTLSGTISTPPKPASGSAAVLSGQAVTNTLAEMHKAAGLTVGGSPAARITPARTRRPLQQSMPLSRNQLFAGFREDDALVSAQSPAPGEISARSPAGGDRFFVRREAWKRLNIPITVRNSTIERSSAALYDLNNSQLQTEEPVEEETAKPCPDTGKKSSNARVQFLDSSKNFTPFQNQRKPTTDGEQQHKVLSPQIFSPRTDTSIRPEGNPVLDATTWSLAAPEDTVLADNENDEKETDDENEQEDEENKTSVTGIRLTKPGYYIFPTKEELKDLVDKSGRCVVQDFVIGRQSYGHILFPGLTDVIGINFDEVVHIRRREVVVYPDDNKKPPIGYGLNRKAEVTLDGIWPTDKSTRDFIKSPQRLVAIQFDERLEKATQKMNATFIEYRPDTGSWVFEVKHFSKYRLEDSDDDDDSKSFQAPASSPPPLSADLPSKLSDYNVLERNINAGEELEKKIEPEGFSTNTSIWKTREFPEPTFQNVKKSLFLDEFHNLNEDLEENEETGFVTAAMGCSFQRRLLDITNSDWKFPLDDNASSDESPRKQAPESYCRKPSPLSISSIEMPSVKTEPVQSINNPMQRVSDIHPSVTHDYLSSVYTFPYDKITAITNDGKKRLTSLSHDSALAQGDGFGVSFSFFRNRETGQHEPMILSRRILHSASLFKDFSPSDGKDCVEEENDREQTGSLFISNWSPRNNLNEEVSLNAALQTSIIQPITAPNADLETSCPQFLPRAGLSVLESYLACTQPEPESKEQPPLYRALTMCQALWGRQSTDSLGEEGEELGLNKTLQQVNGKNKTSLIDTVNDENGGNRESESNGFAEFSIENLAKKQAVSEWIRAQLRPWLEVRLKELGLSSCCSPCNAIPTTLTSVGTSEISEGILACLLSGEIGLACRLAIAGRLPSLASLLGQAPFSEPVCRRGLKRQLQIWHELKMDQRMSLSMLRCYALLAGELDLPHPTARGSLLMHTLEGANYLQALGVHIWYLSDYATDLSVTLKLFACNWHAFSSTAVAAPCPPSSSELSLSPPTQLAIPSITISQHLHEPDVLKSREWPRDVSYHLLQLKLHQWHSLERTLDPRSMRRVAPHLVDVNSSRLHGGWTSSWHVWRVLHSLGYRHLNPVATVRLLTEVADEIEGTGLWEWAIFILLHLHDPEVRAASVKRLLTRHVCLIPRETFRLDEPTMFSLPELFVIERLNVPRRWLHEAKACLARNQLAGVNFSITSRKRRHLLASLEAAHWLAAGHVETAHEVCMHHLLPDMILHSPSTSGRSKVDTSAPSDLRRLRLNGQLASHLLSTLQPFIDLPTEKLPSSFDTGASVYFAYAQVLLLANQLSLLNRAELDNVQMELEDQDGDQSMQADSETLGGILQDLQDAAHILCDQLQTMPTPSIREKVVKSELAGAAAHLISTFLHSRLTTDQTPSDEGNTVELLWNHLTLLSQIGLPGESRLREVEALSTAAIARCLV